MNLDRLEKLDQSVAVLLKDSFVADTIAFLESKIGNSPDPFVWSVVDKDRSSLGLPEDM